MRFVLITVLFLSSSHCVLSQDVQSALFHFENFEYEKALRDFESSKNQDDLNFEDSEKIGYCYYITGSNAKGLPFINSLIEKDESAAHFWLWKGTLEKESGDYASAIQSLETFKSKSSELNVDVLIESCKQMQDWKAYEDYEIENMSWNDMKANSFGLFDGHEIVYYEVGLDSAKNNLSISTSSEVFSQLLLMRPFLQDGEGAKPIALFDNYPELSINSMTLDQNGGRVFFGATSPLSKNSIVQASQIYVAKYSSLDTPLENAALWEYSGELDSSSFSHPAISSDGSLLVFSKMSAKTSGSDLYMSERQGGTWTTPVPLEKLNTIGNEMYPVFQGDSLFQFSTDGRPGYGGLDLYSVNMNDLQEGQNIKHYKSPVNSFMDDFNYHWFNDSIAKLVSNRVNGKGDDDVWLIDLIMPIVPPVVVVDDGFDDWFEKWNLRQIYFDFDSFESLVNQEFIDGYKKYHDKYELELELVGHTDSRGSSKYNLELGSNRAGWMRMQLIRAGIANIISIRSVGDTELVNECAPGVKCSDEEHRLNRFVEIKLTIGETKAD